MNATDNGALSVHGVNPQHLVEKILRNRIYDSMYWKEQCFGLTAETLVDKAIELTYIGGHFGGNQQPTPFLCLLLKMLQIQPDMEIVVEFIKNGDYKYVTILGAFYLRLIGKPVEIYPLLEELLADYRKIRKRTTLGWEMLHVDEVADFLLKEEYFCDIALPHLVDRYQLESTNALKKYVSPLETDFVSDEESDEDGDDDDSD
ncbi:unnamed protein product [Aphanomyces euteiches]|uniref:Pre-mRNA-splicing factor 38 n=1 Tax=Aphanomyces euteiches TaxID=100861 RepID=A0A6G0X5U4_9STRA|nr:hypothetical protein Ae201684_008182 [Aphanomyces euteiches]KAH9070412.1 hypothetical protein Ae201684P_002771 [Aphanomyces euteiches]KAH9109418.1 hypothetical protein AeMF1_015507 [Aphanomyces euteiches]KAH9111086.1 hypothetical protein LEN26_013554 [Aphanomyces euteiches]KAH9136327.1 hypothetical protein AeRB84_018470 [Aphanomyces euteiches]